MSGDPSCFKCSARGDLIVIERTPRLAGGLTETFYRCTRCAYGWGDGGNR